MCKEIQVTEIWKAMLSGEPYDATHPALIEALEQTRLLIKEYNELSPLDKEGLQSLLRSLLGSCGTKIQINQPFHCDYGCNICVGENFFANFNLTILDEGFVTIGDNAFVGPNVSIYTACHPLDAISRNQGIEWSKPVTIGDNCWIGGNVVILPGVAIGNNVVIGAGSIVTKDIPDNELWAGNPACKIKDISPNPQ